MSLTSEEITAKNFKTFYEGLLPYLGSYDKGKLTFVGEVKPFFAETAPNGFLVCDGATYNKADYPQLANLLLSLTDHSAYEVSGDDTKFKVPDLRGEFLRGSGTNSHANQGSGANVGVHQDGTTSIPIRMDANRSFVGGAVGQMITPSNYDSTIGTSNYRAYNVATDTTVNKEDYLITSRPTNTSVLYCIAYKDTMVDLDFLSYGGERFAKSDMYDTNERVIGKWIDGKPLYQKVISFTSLSQGMTIDMSSLNCDTILSYTGYTKAGTSYTNIPTYINNDYHCQYFIENGIIKFNLVTSYFATYRASDGGKLILIYTKTTDTADSFKYSTPTDYSTEEKIVGTWIDGKPLYQKTVNFGVLPNNTTKYVSTGYTGGEIKVVDIRGICYDSSGVTAMTLPRSYPISTYSMDVFVTDNNNEVCVCVISTADQSNTTESYITIQYTKTNDQQSKVK